MADEESASTILQVIAPYVQELVRLKPYTMVEFHLSLKALSVRHYSVELLRPGARQTSIVTYMFQAHWLRCVGRDRYVLSWPVPHLPSRIRPHRTARAMQRIRRDF